MPVTRRAVLAAAAVTAVPCMIGHAVPNSGSTFLGAARDAAGDYWLAAFNRAGDTLLRTKLPQRGHEPIVAPSLQTALVPARRPGDWAAVVDLGDGRVVQLLQASAGRHFYGHGVFSPDGQYLYTTENDFAHDRGLVVCRSARTLEVVGEFDSGGLGPHEINWQENGMIAVANGGIQTHPSQPRRKLNLDSMRPNLTLIRPASGEIVTRVVAPVHQASIRHIDTAANGDVALALQYEGSPTDDIALLYVFRATTGELAPLPVPLAVQRRMRQYTASIRVDPQNNHALVTCPRGHLVTFWEIGGKGYLGHRRIRDAGGAALDRAAREFVVSTGGGSVFRFDTESFQFRRAATQRFPQMRWDNHLAIVPA